MSAWSSIRLIPKFSAFESDENTIAGLRLMRCFLRLKSSARRQELIAVAERLLEEELIPFNGMAENSAEKPGD